MVSLRLENIWKRYGGRWILRGIDLEVNESTVICIYGENGAGKTTLLKIISGLIVPTRGRVLLDGRTDRRFRNSVQGVLLHENVLYEELTVEENINYFKSLYENVNDKIISILVETLGLMSYWKTRVGSLSYGWRKRANIVRAFINNPQVLLLDEPFTGLDINAYRSLLKTIMDLVDGRIILFTISNESDLKRIFNDTEGSLIVMELREGELHELKL